MVLTVVRHAESVYNQLGRSGPDCPLTAEGILQAKALTGYYDYTVCSPMRRTRDTLSLSKITSGEIQFEELARERRDDICDFLANEPNERETFIAFAARMKRLYGRLLALESQHGNVLLVAHAYVILAVHRLRLNKSLPLGNDDLQKMITEYTIQSVPNARLIKMPDPPSIGLAGNSTARNDSSKCEAESDVMP